MMNPYVEWLGLPEGTTKPNHFELLQIDAETVDHVAASAAADRALTQVRGCKPGSNAKEWATLLDEIRTAKKVLSTPESFENYRHEIKSAFMRPPSPGEPLSKPKSAGKPSRQADAPSNKEDEHEAPHELTFDAEAVGGREIQSESFMAQPPESESVETQPIEGTKVSQPAQPSPPDSAAPPTSGPTELPTSAQLTQDQDAPLAAEPVLAAEPTTPSNPPEAPVLKVSTPAKPPESDSPNSMPAAAEAIPAEPAPTKPVPTPPASVPVVTAQPAPIEPAPLQAAPLQAANADPQSIDPMAPVALPISSPEPQATALPVSDPSQAAGTVSPTTAAGTATRQVSEELVVVEESGGRSNKRFIRSVVIGLCCAGLMCIGGYLVADAAGLFDGDDSQAAQSGDGNANDGQNGDGGSGGDGGNNSNSSGTDDGNSNSGGNGTSDNGNDANSTNGSGTGDGGTNGEDSNDTDNGDNGGNDTDTTDTGSTDNGSNDTDQNDTDQNDTDQNDTDQNDTDQNDTGDTSSNGGNDTDTTNDMNDATDSGDDPGEPEAADVIRFGEQLAEVNRLLYERDVEQARQLLESAREINVRPMDMAMADRLELMIDEVERFWVSVEQGVAMLQGGMELKVNETTYISIVEVRTDMLIYRFAGETYRKKPIELPPGLAMIIAEDALPEQASENRIVKGAFYAIERVTDASRRDKAEAFWEEAAFMGADTDDLIAYLDDDYNLAVSLIEQVAMPDAADIDEAQTRVRESYAKDFAAAKTPAERTDLANRLAEEAPKTADLAERYVLLIEARDWAARAGNAPMVLELVDLIDSWFEIDDTLILKGEAIVDAAKVSSGVDASKEVARTALELAEEAERAGDEDLMNELLQSALLASRRSRDREYQTTVRERVDAIRGESGS